MSNVFLQLVPSILFFIYGGAMLLDHVRQRRLLERCTGSVTAHIVDVGRIKQRGGYRYFYKMRYTWQEEKYTAEFTTMEFYGERGEDTVMYIDPNCPKKICVNCSAASRTGNVLFGSAMIVAGIIWLIAGFFWNE